MEVSYPEEISQNEQSRVIREQESGLTKGGAISRHWIDWLGSNKGGL